jgi:hypothetical protein
MNPEDRYLEGAYPGQGTDFFVDIYSFLGISLEDSNDAELVREAFRRKAFVYNADRGVRQAEQGIPLDEAELAPILGMPQVVIAVFQHALWARNVLLDPEKREQYNTARSRWTGPFTKLDPNAPFIAYASEEILQGDSAQFHPDVAKGTIERGVLEVEEEYGNKDYQSATRIADAIIGGALPVDDSITTLVKAGLDEYDRFISAKEIVIREAIGLSIEPVVDPKLDYIQPVEDEILLRRMALIHEVLQTYVQIDSGRIALIPEKTGGVAHFDILQRQVYLAALLEVYDLVSRDIISLSKARKELMDQRIQLEEGILLNQGDLSSNTVIVFSNLEGYPRLLPLKRIVHKGSIAEYKKLGALKDLLTSENVQDVLPEVIAFANENGYWLIQVDHRDGLPIDGHILAVLTKHFTHLDKARRMKRK